MKRKTLFASLLYGTLATTAVLNPAMADVRINGFASVAFGMSDQNADSLGADETFFLGYSDKLNTTEDSLAGLQFGFDINDSMTGTIQLIAKGEDDWQPEMEWAYLSYNTEQGAMFRAGKLRAPIYMYSDYLDLRYAQPFVRPSNGFYSLVRFTSYTGVDAVLPLELGDHLDVVK